MKTVPVK